MTQPACKRYETSGGVEYEILSSNKKTYYTVPMMRGKATGCECRGAQFRPTCKHQEEAEKQERLYLEERQTQKPEEPQWQVDAPLNGARTFSILR